MLRNIVLKTLRDRRRSLLFWGLGLVALAAMMVAFYPVVRDATFISEYLESFPEEFLALFAGEVIDYSSPEGFLHGELFFLMYPLLLLVFAIGFGSGAVAGEEESSTLDLLLSNPLNRWRLVLEKFTAMVICILLLTFVFWATLTIGGAVIDMGLNLLHLAAVCFSGALLAISYSAIALAVGCARGKRGLSMGVAGALGVYGYVLNALAPLIDWLEPFQVASPFYYYIDANPLSNGLDPLHAAVLIGLTVLFLVIALITFERRDLAV
ncbi:MAG: ABC transporter permease subunit [Dehalococcoidales bacterium]|nr:MAG: ABC transporter permease subunit [Dehalococcoidales bacterium]